MLVVLLQPLSLHPCTQKWMNALKLYSRDQFLGFTLFFHQFTLTPHLSLSTSNCCRRASARILLLITGVTYCSHPVHQSKTIQTRCLAQESSGNTNKRQVLTDVVLVLTCRSKTQKKKRLSWQLHSLWSQGHGKAKKQTSWHLTSSACWPLRLLGARRLGGAASCLSSICCAKLRPCFSTMVESFLFFFGGIGPLGFAPAPSPTMTARSVLNQPRPAGSQEV
jgi:hypothetical protein